MAKVKQKWQKKLQIYLSILRRTAHFITTSIFISVVTPQYLWTVQKIFNSRIHGSNPIATHGNVKSVDGGLQLNGVDAWLDAGDYYGQCLGDPDLCIKGFSFALQVTFRYDSDFWSDKETFNVAGGQTVFDTQETKLTTYWDTPFTKICLGMRLPGEQNINFLAINQAANSLYSLLADGQHRATSLGRDAWKTLIGSQASLQMNCNMEGFNARCFWEPRCSARIGIVANNQDDCRTCDSRIGFGSGGSPDDSNTCGQAAKNGPDNGNSFIKAMCYVFVH